MNASASEDQIVDHMTVISLIVNALPHVSSPRAAEFLARLERCAQSIIDATPALEPAVDGLADGN